MGDFDKAIKYHTQHLAIAKEVRDLKGEGRAYGNLRIAYLDELEEQPACDNPCSLSPSACLFGRVGR